jgi:hypothetical protein
MLKKGQVARARILSLHLEQMSGSKSIAEFYRGNDQDTVLCPASFALQADNDALLDSRVILSQRPQAFEMVLRYFGCGFCFDRYLHIINNKIDLYSARQTPIAESGESFFVSVERAKLMKNPIFKSFAVKLGSRLRKLKLPLEHVLQIIMIK